jgi:hypothetical protein
LVNGYGAGYVRLYPMPVDGHIDGQIYKNYSKLLIFIYRMAERQTLGYTDGDGTTANPFAAPVPASIADPARRPAALAIAEAAFRLNRLRENWLNPPEWVE